MASSINASTTSGLVQTADTSGILQFQTASTTAMTIDATQNVTFAGGVTFNGSTSLGTLTVTGNTNLATTSGNVGIGTASPTTKLYVKAATAAADVFYAVNSNSKGLNVNTTASDNLQISHTNTNYNIDYWVSGTGVHTFSTAGLERLRVNASGNVQLSTAGTSILNSSGNKILNQTGSVLQVVSVNDTTQYVFNSGSSSQTTYYNITGMVASITPSSTSSKIMLMANITAGQANNTYNAFFRATRNGTVIGVGVAGGYPGTSTTAMRTSDGGEIGTNIIMYLDSPATTSAVTYQIQICNAGGSGSPSYVNRPQNSSTGWEQSGASSITLMEIAG